MWRKSRNETSCSTGASPARSLSSAIRVSSGDAADAQGSAPEVASKKPRDVRMGQAEQARGLGLGDAPFARLSIATADLAYRGSAISAQACPFQHPRGQLAVELRPWLWMPGLRSCPARQHRRRIAAYLTGPEIGTKNEHSDEHPRPPAAGTIPRERWQSLPCRAGGAAAPHRRAGRAGRLASPPIPRQAGWLGPGCSASTPWTGPCRRPAWRRMACTRLVARPTRTGRRRRPSSPRC